MRHLIIGADGGGTKTNLVVVDRDSGKILGQSRAKSINSWFIGPEKAAENLCAGIHALPLQKDDRIEAVSIGDPSLDDAAESAGNDEFIRALRLRGGFGPSIKILSKSDVFMALYALSRGEPGVLLVSGTGSMGIALKTRYRHGEANSLCTVGGWGEPTCDPGSGYDIAVRGIGAALNAFDGVGESTALCGAVLRFFGVENPRGLIEIFNGGKPARSEIAAFAREVDDSAGSEDGVSCKILEQAGQMLARYALSLLQQIGLPGCTVGIAGSILTRCTMVQEAFRSYLTAACPDTRVCIPEKPPEYGAALFAADSLKNQKEMTEDVVL